MSVAKSYEKYEIVGDPYEHDKRLYVQIKYPCCRKSSCSKCGGQGYYLKEVRWYDDGKSLIAASFDGRAAFGFGEEGYITLLKGSQKVLETFFQEVAPRQARYNLLFFWYIPSHLPIPSNLPQGIEPIRLDWEEISVNNKIGDYDQIKEYVGDIISTNGVSKYVGEVGDKIENRFTVVETIVNKGYYGDTNTYILEDSNSNRYAWKTSARKLYDGESYYLKGTIKEHTKIEGIEHTILTRCREG